MSIQDRLNGVVDRLVHKIEMSQTPVPGFILGLSGTDSIIAFEVLARGLARIGKPHRLHGIHYIDPTKKPGNFLRNGMAWLRDRHPSARFTIIEPMGGNYDPQRWADLHLQALNEIILEADGGTRVIPLDEKETYWVSGTINATEHALGKHTVAANAVSIQPIRSLWKTDIIEACFAIGVPAPILEAARLPDCLCGRDEVAAEHIELIDDILRYRFDVRAHDPELVMMLMAWVADRKREGGFRSRIPYIV
jgi:NH3-dependent NAD+ synthetase